MAIKEGGDETLKAKNQMAWVRATNSIRSRAEEIVFRELIYAISKGKLHLVTTVASTVFNKGTEPRITDTLRNRKNYLIILNTLLRKAAEMSGVHPLHIDKISSDFARQIEGIPSIRQSLSLQEKMIREYCLLVKKYSLKNTPIMWDTRLPWPIMISRLI